MILGTYRVQGIFLASKFPRSQSNPKSLMDSDASQPTGLEGSAANVLVPNTTGHIQGCCRVYASSGQWCLAEHRGQKAYKAYL